MNPLLVNHLIGFFFNVIVLVGIALLVYKSRPYSVLHRAFASNQFAIAWWSFFTMFMISAPSKDWGMFWDRMCLSGVVFIPATLFHYVVGFTGDDYKSRKIVYVNYGLGVFFLITLWLTRLFVDDVRPKFGMNYFTVPGPLYAAFVGVFVINVILGLISLWKFIKRAPTDRVRRQSQLLFWFSLIGYGSGTCNYLLVYDIKLSGVAETSNYGVLFLSVSLAYIIFKHRFLDIEVVIKKTIVFAGLFGMALLTMTGVTSASQFVIERFFNVPPTLVTAISLLIAIILYEPVRRLLVDATDRYLFQKKVNYRRLLKEASQEMAVIKNLKQLARLVVAFLIKKGRIAATAVYIRPNADSDFKLEAFRHVMKKGELQAISKVHPLIRYFETEKRWVELYELEHQIKQGLKELEPIFNLLKEFKIEAIVPSFFGRQSSTDRNALELRSLLLLGPKKSDEPYSQEELDIFYTLAQESAIAVENARLYDEGMQKTKENTELKLQLMRKQTLANVAGSVAHEINGPVQHTTFALINIKRALEKLKNMPNISEGPEIQKKSVADFMKLISDNLIKIDRSNNRQHTTAQTIARFKKGMAGKDVGKMKPEDIREEDFEKHAIEVYMDLTIIAENAKIEFQGRSDYMVELEMANLAHNLPYIKMNQSMFEQVMMNLLLNAYDAMKGREIKKITVEAKTDSENSDFMHFEIKDTGAGIPDGLKEKIWEPDFSTKGNKGTGMGLYICRLLVEKIHHGKIWCESQLGVGTHFHIKIPIWKEEIMTGQQKTGDAALEN